MVVVTGFTGQLSLCQYALGGFGAWMTARMIASNGLGLEPALLIGVASAALLGAVVAIPALRTRGVSLAVVTFGLALLLESIVFNSTLLGGIGGRFVLPTLLGIHIDPLHHPDRYLMVAIVLFALAAVAVANVRRGASGRRLLAVRSNERAAASLGVGVYGAKVYGFALAAAIAGLGGTLVAFRTPRIGFGALSVSSSISAVLYSLVGGIAWVSGSIIAATLSPGALNTKLLNDNFPQIGDVASWLALATSVAVVVMLRFAPDGAAASISRAARRAVPRTGRGARRPDPDQHSISGPTEPRRSPPVQGLTVTDVTVDFGGIRALDHVSFEVRTGEVVGLIGPNGAGKTTILDVISGFTAPDHGSVRLDGRSLDRLGPERRARAGIIRSWQHVELFDGLSVRENLLVAADPQLRRRYVTDLVKPGRPRWSALLQEVVDELQLGALLDVRPSSLSHGESRLVGIARAIVAEPAVLLLDEPAAGLDPRERGELAGIIRRLVVRLGIPVLAIEHDVALLLSVCDRIIVMEDGRVIASGTPEEVTRDAAVIRAYLGDVATLAD
jgi:ABC-type branched-subunit amino acid transport system ATPase component/ABC-type branched-subunit amino acid transport system permease subunit